MIGRKSTPREIATSKAKLAEKQRMNPGVVAANERNLARAQQINQRTSSTSPQRPVTGGVQNMNRNQIENLRSQFQTNRQPKSSLSEALAQRPVGGGEMSMGAGNVMRPSQPTPISGMSQMPSGGAGGMMQSMQGGAQMPQGSTGFQPPAGGFGGMMNSMQGAAPQGMKKGGMVKSKGVDGCATKGKTKGRYI